ncbi:MAG: DUF2764 family protein [Candidatus Omnitrophota bacterium]
MANKYYYLVSSLPFLRFAQPGHVNKQAFLSECRKWLSENDMEMLESAAPGSAGRPVNDTPVLRAWKEFDKNLRSELALARAWAKGNRHDKPVSSAKVVWEQANPLLMEQSLERLRWGYLDYLEAGNFFDINFLILYFLKLQIIERLGCFNKENGEAVFRDMCEVNYE